MLAYSAVAACVLFPTLWAAVRYLVARGAPILLYHASTRCTPRAWFALLLMYAPVPLLALRVAVPGLAAPTARVLCIAVATRFAFLGPGEGGRLFTRFLL